jgi:hypothetical protein
VQASQPPSNEGACSSNMQLTVAAATCSQQTIVIGYSILSC